MEPKHREYLGYLERHRHFVLEEAIKLGIRHRGLAHDLSKYSEREFDPYAEYFYGGHARGNVPEAVQADFDLAWLFHQKENDHHWQSRLLRFDDGRTTALRMEEGALLEMIADWRGISVARKGVDESVLWYGQNRDKMVLHPDTRAEVERILGYTVEV